MKFTKKTIYIGLFSVLYLIVAFSSFWHACAFFGLANNSWMSVILAFAFEIGQAAVLFSLLTSKKDRSRVMPWVLMTMFTLVQVIGNVFSSYKHIVLNSIDNLKYFKEPIFIWTNLPDDQATVIIVYIVGAILPVCALLLTSMITNYLSDQEEIKEPETNPVNDEEKNNEFEEDSRSDNRSENKELQEAEDTKQSTSEKSKNDEQNSNEHESKLNEKIEKLKEDHDKILDEKFDVQQKFDNLLEDYSDQNKELGKIKKELEELKAKKTIVGTDPDGGVIGEQGEDGSKYLNKYGMSKPQDKSASKEIEDLIKNGINENNETKVSHFINQ